MSSPNPDPDDVAYHKSVRNTVKVLAVVVAVLVAALVFSAYFDVAPNTFQTSTSVASPYPFTLSLAVNATSMMTSGSIAISAWLNGTTTGNVTAISEWMFNQSSLVSQPCRSGFPLGVGVMQGHYTLDNYSLGSLVMIRQPIPSCQVFTPPPPWFYFSSQTSKVLVTIRGTPAFWVLSTGVTFDARSIGLPRLSPGVYTALAADEWGDFVMTNFRVS